jgi:diguanylate cyclase (GGDEF)-like protein
MILAAAAALLDCVWLVPLHPDAGPLVAVINAPIAAVAAIGFVAIRSVARRRPETVVLVVLLAVDLAIVALRIAHPTLELVADGYFVLLPPIVALVVPWETEVHVGWLVAHVGLVLAVTLLAPADAGSLGGVGPMSGLLVVSATASVFGHLAGLEARVASFVQIQQIRALHREARRDRSRLDRLNAVLERSARTDELTGLGNRLSLNVELAAVRSRIERHRERYALLLLDLDHFKAINDALGHLAGDGVLRTVAQAAASAVRAGDGVYRYGGEEFVVVVRIARPTEAIAAAERVRAAIAHLALPHPANPPHDRVTVSIGAATIASGDLDDDDEAWLALADQALYAAKAAGRNACRFAQRSASAVAATG